MPFAQWSRGRASGRAKETLVHADALYNLARYLTRDPNDAEDLVQETYERALGAWDLLERDTNVQRPLRERRLGRTQAVEHQLPPQVENRGLHRVGVQHPQVALQHERHREQSRRHRLPPAGAGAAVHRLELRLEPVVEDLVPVLAQEAASARAQARSKARGSRADGALSIPGE
jgi:hypothetical protein